MRRKSGDKKKKIAEASVRVFAREGFHGAMISRIAEEAGVATGSVYLYFDGKEDILQHLFSGLWRRLHEMFQGVVQDSTRDPGEKIEALIDGVFGIFADDPPLAQVFVQEQQHLVRVGSGPFLPYYEEFLAMGREVFREGVESGLLRNDLNPVVFTHIVYGSLRQLLNYWARNPESLSFRKIQVDLKGIITRGIRA